MKKLAGFCLGVSLVFVVISCGGTRNVTTEKHENITIENEYQEGSKIVLGNSFSYTPFDALKPMKIEGKVYENAIVSNDKSKTIIKWKKQIAHITKTITIHRTTIRKDDTLLWVCIVLGSLLIICFFVWLWFYLPKIKNPLN